MADHHRCNIANMDIGIQVSQLSLALFNHQVEIT
jgi:hypothetical protein